MHKLVSTEENILKLSVHFMGFLTLLGTVMFFSLIQKHQIHLNPYVGKVILAYGFFTSVFCFVSSKIKSLRYSAIILLSFFIAIVGSFQQMNISLLFIIPVFQGYCFQNKKKAYSILFLNILFFNVSRVFKSYNIYMQDPNLFNFKMILFSNLLISVFETIVFLTIAIPVFMLLIKQNGDLRKSLKEKDEATNDILQFCSTATSFHNKYLSVHIKGVRDITKVILDALIEDGVVIEPYYYMQIIFSVQFHDIGKIYIDSSVLDKKGKLSDSEFDIIKEHPIRGIELFRLLPKNVLDENYMNTCMNVILQHHERLDGTGYPTGTKDISFEAKIVSIADVVDALLSWRPYKPPLKWDNMVAILEEKKAGFSYECLKVVYQEKERILAISDANNITLKEMLHLSEDDIVRQ